MFDSQLMADLLCRCILRGGGNLRRRRHRSRIKRLFSIEMPASFSSRTEKPTVPILHTVPSTPDALPTAPIRHLRLSPQDLRPGSQRLHPNPSGANLVSPPPKRTQPRCENKEVLRGTIVRHRARQRAAHGNQRRRMRADKQRLAGALVGALRLLQGRDLGVHVGDYACERGGEAIVQLGDGLAAGRGDEVRLVL